MKNVLIFALFALAACSRPGPPPPAPDAGSSVVSKGVIEAPGGLVRVLSPRDGVIAASLVEEGDVVTAGQPLARLEDRQQRLVIDAAAADMGDRRAQVDIAAARAAGADREARRLGGLAGADAAPKQEAEQAATAAAIAHGEHRQAVGALQAAEARERLSAYEIEVRTIRAAAPGRVVRRTTTAGAYVAAASPLFVLEPQGPRLVRAELDEAFADRVTPGMSATVSREFQAGKSYTAKVLRVSDVLAGPSLSEDAVTRADVRIIAVILALPPGADLRLGQRVLVRFAR